MAIIYRNLVDYNSIIVIVIKLELFSVVNIIQNEKKEKSLIII